MRNECPMKKKFKRKAMKATTWSNSEESDSDDETQHEIANMCFMAIEDEVTSPKTKSSTNEYDELLEAFEELHDEYEKVILKNKVLKKKILENALELETLQKEKSIEKVYESCDSLKKENLSLHEKVEDLTRIAHNFTNGKKNFDLMLGSQRCVFNKGGLGYRPFLKQKYLKNYFVKASSSNDQKLSCTYCNKIGHTSFHCFVKKNDYFGKKNNWVYKDSRTNLQGPKKIWVPKIKV